jgi:hypothetical protein
VLIHLPKSGMLPMRLENEICKPCVVAVETRWSNQIHHFEVADCSAIDLSKNAVPCQLLYTRVFRHLPCASRIIKLSTALIVREREIPSMALQTMTGLPSGRVI